MRNKMKAVLYTSVAAGLGLSFLNCQVATADMPPPQAKEPSTSGQTKFATIPVQEKRLSFLVENAKVSIVRKGSGQEITIASNSPGNWNVQEGYVRQAVVAGRKGVGMSSDHALGARAIMQGLVYTMPTGQVKGLQMNKDGVFVNGEKLQPLQGNGKPQLEGEDTLTVTVPDAYAGGLSIACAGKSQVKVSNWKGSDIQLTLAGDSSIEAGHLSAINKAIVDNRGSGSAKIDGINAKIFVANLQGHGSVNVGDGAAEMSNATASGTGTMTLKGDFKNLKQAVDGQAKIEVLK